MPYLKKNGTGSAVKTKNDPRNQAQVNAGNHLQEFILKMKKESYIVDFVVANSKKHGTMCGIEAKDKLAAKQIVNAIVMRPELFMCVLDELVKVRKLLDKKNKA